MTQKIFRNKPNECLHTDVGYSHTLEGWHENTKVFKCRDCGEKIMEIKRKVGLA